MKRSAFALMLVFCIVGLSAHAYGKEDKKPKEPKRLTKSGRITVVDDENMNFTLLTSSGAPTYCVYGPGTQIVKDSVFNIRELAEGDPVIVIGDMRGKIKKEEKKDDDKDEKKRRITFVADIICKVSRIGTDPKEAPSGPDCLRGYLDSGPPQLVVGAHDCEFPLKLSGKTRTYLIESATNEGFTVDTNVLVVGYSRETEEEDNVKARTVFVAEQVRVKGRIAGPDYGLLIKHRVGLE